ncbi:MAG TPA: glycosyltransferase family 2 protein, partial [Archangium sp.]
MKRPAISIIVPVYNLEFYVERTLTSLLQQTVEDLEFVVVDDGSTDDTSAIVAEFAARDSRFRVFRKQNGGHGSACNLGIEHARGEYVLFCDGDDWLSPDTCRRMLELARGYDVDLLLGNLTYFHANQTRSSFTPLRSGGERLLDARDRSLLFTNFATPCGRMYRRELFDDPAIRFLPRILFADVSFAPKTYYAARRIAYVNESFYNYDLTRPTQSMQQRDARLLNV